MVQPAEDHYFSGHKSYALWLKIVYSHLFQGNHLPSFNLTCSKHTAVCTLPNLHAWKELNKDNFKKWILRKTINIRPRNQLLQHKQNVSVKQPTSWLSDACQISNTSHLAEIKFFQVIIWLILFWITFAQKTPFKILSIYVVIRCPHIISTTFTRQTGLMAQGSLSGNTLRVLRFLLSENESYNTCSLRLIPR